MTAWGREHKAACAADQVDRKAGFQDCLTLCIKQQFVAGLKPAIRQVIESKYASLTTRTLLLKAAREAKIALSTGPDKRIMARLYIILYYIIMAIIVPNTFVKDLEHMTASFKPLLKKGTARLWTEEMDHSSSKSCYF